MLWILGALGLLLVALPVAGVLWMTAVPGRSHAGALPPLTPEQVELAARLQDHVRAIASRPHNLGHPEELERAAVHIEAALEGMGYAVRRQPFSAAGREVRNIEVVIEPAASAAEAPRRWWWAPTTTATAMPRAPTTTAPGWRPCSSWPGSSRTCGGRRR